MSFQTRPHSQIFVWVFNRLSRLQGIRIAEHYLWFTPIHRDDSFRADLVTERGQINNPKVSPVEIVTYDGAYECESSFISSLLVTFAVTW